MIGSSSSLHSEACNALGVSDGVIHSRISWEATIRSLKLSLCFWGRGNGRAKGQAKPWHSLAQIGLPWFAQRWCLQGAETGGPVTVSRNWCQQGTTRIQQEAAYQSHVIVFSVFSEGSFYTLFWGYGHNRCMLHLQDFTALADAWDRGADWATWLEPYVRPNSPSQMNMLKVS